MKLAAKMWVAVFDGGQGVILVNQGTAMEPKLVALRHYGHANPPSHEQGRDSPGRVHEALGQHRSAVEAPDPHQKAEDKFLAGVIADLEKEAAAGAYEKIVVVAPPVALGVMRTHYGPKLQHCLVKEIASDYVKRPLGDIAAAVSKALE